MSVVTLFSFASWILITFLFTKVSGIPMAEKRFQNNKNYQKYQKKTSSFIIWFKKN